MNRRLLVQVTAPTVLIGLLLFAVCLVSAWSVNHLQSRLSSILSQNVTSLEAAQGLEVNLRKLRFHCFCYLLETANARANSALRQELLADDRAFRADLEKAERSAYTSQEAGYVREIRAAYQHYQEEFELLIRRPPPPQPDYEELAGLNPVLPVIEPCQRYLDANKEQMNQTRRESERVSQLLRGVLPLLGNVFCCRRSCCIRKVINNKPANGSASAGRRCATNCVCSVWPLIKLLPPPIAASDSPLYEASAGAKTILAGKKCPLCRPVKGR